MSDARLASRAQAARLEADLQAYQVRKTLRDVLGERKSDGTMSARNRRLRALWTVYEARNLRANQAYERQMSRSDGSR